MMRDMTIMLMTDAPAEDVKTMLLNDASQDYRVNDGCISRGHKQQKRDIEQHQMSDVGQLPGLLA